MRSIKTISKEEWDYMIDNLGKISDRSIAKKLDLHQASVRYWRVLAGLKAVPMPRRKWNEAATNKLLQMIKEEKTVNDIAKEFKISAGGALCLATMLRKRGYDVRKRGERLVIGKQKIVRRTKEEMQRIRQIHNDKK